MNELRAVGGFMQQFLGNTMEASDLIANIRGFYLFIYLFIHSFLLSLPQNDHTQEFKSVLGDTTDTESHVWNKVKRRDFSLLTATQRIHSGPIYKIV